MKKRMLSIITVLAILVFASMTAFATPYTANLTINEETLETGKTVTAVRMFKDDSDMPVEPETATTPHFVLESAWIPFFADLLDIEIVDENNDDVADNADAISVAAYNYVVAMQSESPALIAFADAAKEHYLANTANFASLTTTEDSTDGQVIFTSLPAGSYLVYPVAGSTSETRHTDAMFVTLRDENVTINLKSVYPTIDKKVKTTDAAAFTDDTHAQVGDYVQFQLNAEVPDMTEYTSINGAPAYTFTFHDTLSNGLTFVKDATHPLAVTISHTQNNTTTTSTLTETTDYTLTLPNPTAETNPHNNLTVAINDLKTYIAENNLNAGDDITVTYYARVNANAVVTTAENTAYIEYTNNPTTGGTGNSEPDDSTVYTYDIKIFKYTKNGEGNNAAEISLAGAVFKVKTVRNSTNPDDILQLIDLGTDNGNNVYRVATAEEIADNTVTKTDSVVTPANGTVIIKGLDLGTYYLQETQQPTGYNILTQEIEVVITADNPSTADTTEEDLTNVYYIIDNNTTDLIANNDEVKVENRAGAVLPTTGGMGTIILTVLGVSIVIIGIILPVIKRKKKDAK